VLAGPGPGRVGGDAADVHGPGADLHREQDSQAPQDDGAGVQDARRHNPGGLRGVELPPGR
jgi:hypothetical protein